jgi:cytidine deaminase
MPNGIYSNFEQTTVSHIQLFASLGSLTPGGHCTYVILDFFGRFFKKYEISKTPYLVNAIPFIGLTAE